MSSPTSKPDLAGPARQRRRNSAVTLADVARAAGVSQVAVSVVLNGAKTGTRTSAETRMRVMAAAEQLGYRPNATARALAKGRANAIGVVVNNLDLVGHTNIYFLEVFSGIIEGALSAGQITVVFTLRDWEEAAQQVPAFCDQRVDGLVLIGPMLTQDAAAWMPAHASFVSVHGNCVIPGVVNLESDEEAGAFDMVSHMLALGHRRILHVGGPLGALGAERRIAGYLRAHAAAGVEPPADHVSRTAFSEEGGRVALQDWLLRHRGSPLPEAVFGANDAIALGCIDVLLARELRVPRDISVVGFDDTLLARSARIATVQQPLHKLGSLAVRVLTDCIDARLDGRRWDGEHNIVLPTTMVPRATLAAPRRKALVIA